jgi:hypothetical protein
MKLLGMIWLVGMTGCLTPPAQAHTSAPAHTVEYVVWNQAGNRAVACTMRCVVLANGNVDSQCSVVECH